MRTTLAAIAAIILGYAAWLAVVEALYVAFP